MKLLFLEHGMLVRFPIRVKHHRLPEYTKEVVYVEGRLTVTSYAVVLNHSNVRFSGKFGGVPNFLCRFTTVLGFTKPGTSLDHSSSAPRIPLNNIEWDEKVDLNEIIVILDKQTRRVYARLLIQKENP